LTTTGGKGALQIGALGGLEEGGVVVAHADAGDGGENVQVLVAVSVGDVIPD